MCRGLSVRRAVPVRRAVSALRAVPARWGLPLGLLALGLIAGACGIDDDRPPTRPSCTGEDCRPSQPGVPGSGGDTGTGGGLGEGGAGSSDRITLTGTIVQFTETQFVQVTGFTGPGTLEVYGPSGLPTTGTFIDGGFTLPDVEITLPDVESSSVVWALARPDSEALHYPTWTPVPAVANRQTTLPLVLRSLIEEIMSSLAVPAIPEPGTAQVVLRILDSNQAPLAGVTVASPGAQLVVYAAQGTWSEVETATDVTGLVLLGNIAASAVPGNELQLTFGGAASGNALVRVANDTATVVEMRAP